MQLLLIHYTRPAHTHVYNVRLPPPVITVQLQNAHAALAPAHTLNEIRL
jgi:hypothetical protein